MSGSLTKYGDISPRVGVVAAKRLLTRGQYMMVLERFGQVDPQPKNSGQTRKYRRYLSLARATTPLSEGVTPDGQKLNYEDITVQLNQYGDYLELTDVIEDTHEDPVLMEMMDLVGEQVAETIEWLRYIVVRAGTTVFYSASSGTATSRTEVSGEITREDLRKVFRFLHKNKAKYLTKLVAATPNIATSPIDEAFFSVGHTDLMATFQDMTDFVSVEKYSNPSVRIPGEKGKIENCRIVLSSFYEPWLEAGAAAAADGDFLSGGVSATSGDNADVYPVITFARDAYSIVPLQGMNAVTPMVLNPKPRGGDPLGQRGSVGWKTWDASVILNQSWITRNECVAKAL